MSIIFLTGKLKGFSIGSPNMSRKMDWVSSSRRARATSTNNFTNFAELHFSIPRRCFMPGTIFFSMLACYHERILLHGVGWIGRLFIWVSSVVSQLGAENPRLSKSARSEHQPETNGIPRKQRSIGLVGLSDCNGYSRTRCSMGLADFQKNNSGI